MAKKPTPPKSETRTAYEAELEERLRDAEKRAAEAEKRVHNLTTGVNAERAQRYGSGDHVTVALKIHVPSLALQLSVPKKVMENTQTGAREVTVWVRDGKIVVVRGTAYPVGTPPEGFPEKPEVHAGYALNHGISKAFWEAWVDQNKLNPIVVNRMIVAGPRDVIKAMCAENERAKSGLEPVRPATRRSPEGDPRVPRSTNGAVSNVVTESDRESKIDQAIAQRESHMNMEI